MSGNSRGIVSYARVWVCLPCTTSEAAEKTGISRDWLQEMMKQMRFCEIIHRSGVKESVKSKFPEAIHSAGSGVNKAYLGRLSARPKKINSHAVAFASIIRALYEPKTVAELINETGLASDTIYKVVKTLRAAKKAYVCSYDQRHGSPAQVFTLGERWDARRPEPMGMTEMNQGYNRRRRIREAAERVQSAWSSDDCHSA